MLDRGWWFGGPPPRPAPAAARLDVEYWLVLAQHHAAPGTVRWPA
jgi:hypothetical protein